ncbi:MAG: zinc ribbon domain-containing protein [Oscillatoriaceae cyanobacterium Prado104]|nr:zinc ribbon domain-containing protein [Oscillatoriaceae cyanobacterium Prado104]
MTASQKRTINYWLGVSRFVYNETIRYFQNGGKGGWKSIKTAIIQGLPGWCKDCPYQIKSIAVKDACQARSNAYKKHSRLGIVSRLRFRTKKDAKQSCYIPKSAISSKTLSHYKFKQFLKHKAKETGKVVLDVNEAYTSKTVSWTGEIIKNLGGAKTIKSPSTGQTMNRDLNGARGIFLRTLVDTPWLRSNLSLSIC